MTDQRVTTDEQTARVEVVGADVTRSVTSDCENTTRQNGLGGVQAEGPTSLADPSPAAAGPGPVPVAGLIGMPMDATSEERAALKAAVSAEMIKLPAPELSPETRAKHAETARLHNPGNFRALKHGRRSRRPGFAIVHLANGERSIEADLHLLRKALETECRRVLNLPDADPLPLLTHSQIDLTVSFERTHRLAGRLASKAKDAERRIEFEKTCCWAAQQRHAMIEKLTGGKATSAPPDPWAEFDAMRARQAIQARQAANGRMVAADASGDATESDGGQDR